MGRRYKKSSDRSNRQALVLKANGKIDEQVRQVGPANFGIVTVDCHKARAKWMLCDFFGNPLIEPAEVEHTRTHFKSMIKQINTASEQYKLKRVIVVVERTGKYHLPAQRSLRAAGFTTRIVHPFATKQYRQPSNPGVKTDDNDLAAIHRAAVVGLALQVSRHNWPARWQRHPICY